MPAAHKKLREILIAKGVAETEIHSRMQEVVAAIGDQGIQECFSGFDPWQSLKNKCQGKVRLVKASEQRPQKARSKQRKWTRCKKVTPGARHYS